MGKGDIHAREATADDENATVLCEAAAARIHARSGRYFILIIVPLIWILCFRIYNKKIGRAPRANVGAELT